MKPIDDKKSYYPYLPDYEGTNKDREKIIASRLQSLLCTLQEAERKMAEKKIDISLLSEIKKCQSLVNDMLAELS